MSVATKLKQRLRQERQVTRDNRADAMLPMEPFTRKSAEEMAGANARLTVLGMSSADHYYAGWVNNRYVVLASAVLTAEWGRCEHLWVRRADDRNLFPWQDLQRIKDELMGPERVALEVFPARSALVDVADMRHLWVLPAGKSLPFTLS